MIEPKFSDYACRLLHHAGAALQSRKLSEDERARLTEADRRLTDLRGIADRWLQSVPDDGARAKLDAFFLQMLNAGVVIGGLCTDTEVAASEATSANTAKAREARRARRAEHGKASQQEITAAALAVIPSEKLRHPSSASRTYLPRVNKRLAETGRTEIKEHTLYRALKAQRG